MSLRPGQYTSILDRIAHLSRPPEVDVPITSVRIPTFVTPWNNVGGAYYTTSYHKDSTGRVYLRGAVVGGASPSTIFTLPEGYRPSATAVFLVQGDGGPSRVEVEADGDVRLTFLAGAGNIYLDGISFRAA